MSFSAFCLVVEDFAVAKDRQFFSLFALLLDDVIAVLRRLAVLVILEKDQVKVCAFFAFDQLALVDFADVDTDSDVTHGFVCFSFCFWFESPGALVAQAKNDCGLKRDQDGG
jgi:hypothetical protein